MKLFFKAKDGGPLSKVTGYWLIESKKYFSIVLLKFDYGSREAFHTHAFNAISWVLKGSLEEVVLGERSSHLMAPSILPVLTKKARFHKVIGLSKSTWVLSFRGPWDKNWLEYLPENYKILHLSSGRKVTSVEFIDNP